MDEVLQRLATSTAARAASAGGESLSLASAATAFCHRPASLALPFASASARATTASRAAGGQRLSLEVLGPPPPPLLYQPLWVSPVVLALQPPVRWPAAAAAS